jgi:hypothetical protein
MASQKVAKLGIQRDHNYLYYIKGGDVWQVPRKQPGMKKGKASKLADGGVKMESGFIYFLDKAGDISRTKAMVGGQVRKKTRKKTRASAAKKVKARRPAARKKVKRR